MKLTIESLKDKAAWEAANIALPSYDVAEVVERAKKIRCGFILER